MNDTLLRDYLFELYQATSFNDRFNIYYKYTRKLGFEDVAYSIMPGIQFESIYKKNPVFMSSGSFSTDFLDHYSSEELIKDDFTIRNIKDNKLSPMDWRDYEKNMRLREKEKNLILLAREDYGIRNALSIPTMKNDLGIAGASIICSDNDNAFKGLKQERMRDLVFITHRFHESNLNKRNLPKMFVAPFLEYLTVNEIGILCHLASGQHFQRIEYSIDIASYKVASNALNNLRKKKFNNITKERLMYLCGFINLNEMLE